MKLITVLLSILLLSVSTAFAADLPEKNRSKDVPPTLVIGRDEGKYGPTGTSVPIMHHDKPVTKYYPKSKEQIEEDELENVQIYIK